MGLEQPGGQHRHTLLKKYISFFAFQTSSQEYFSRHSTMAAWHHGKDALLFLLIKEARIYNKKRIQSKKIGVNNTSMPVNHF